jgi:hypothetical protein
MGFDAQGQEANTVIEKPDLSIRKVNGYRSRESFE